MNYTLPIYKYKDEIINAVKDNNIVIVTAETGSGKSTQVCQYLYEAGYDVIVTQPRRLAAVSLAQRVAEEMRNKELVGYHTGFESDYTDLTKILFCTDGLQLVKSLAVDTQKMVSKVLIIDEVHEWNLNIETLLAWVKKSCLEGWDLKVVVMSATLKHEVLQEYFGVLSVVHLDITGVVFPVTFKERYDSQLIASVVELVQNGKNVLVFVAGKKEINDVIDELGQLDLGIVLLPLHGELTVAEQMKCFKNYKQPKVVVATNVAQTSVTVPDIDAVVDSGMERRSEYENGVQGLSLRRISRADCLQRRGRAGRTKEGTYILCSAWKFAERPEYSVPEIQRSSLEQLVLRLMAVGLDATKLEFFHQPKLADLVTAKEILIGLGAISHSEGKDVVTDIGYKMVKMPISVKYARMIVEAEKLGVVDDVITIASILEIGGLLNRNAGNYSKFTKEITSDLLAELDVWNELQKMTFIDYKKLGVNGKNYGKVKELRNKLEFNLNNLVSFGSTGDRDAIKKSCIVGMLHYVFKPDSNFYGNLIFKGFRYGEYNLSDNSCCKFKNDDLLVGIPIQIEYKNKFGVTSKMSLITNATVVSSDYLIRLAPHLVTVEQSTWNYRYNETRDVCEILQWTRFNGVTIKEDYVVSNDEEKYREVKEAYERRIRDTYSYTSTYTPPVEYVDVEGHKFKIEESWRVKGKYITLSKQELFSLADTKVIRTDNDVVLSVYCGGIVSNNVKLLQDKIETQYRNTLWTDFCRGLPKTCVSSLRSIDVLLEQVGVVTIGTSLRDATLLHGYVHLRLKNGSVSLALTDDENEADTSTLEALQHLLQKEVTNSYGEKKFAIKIDGKRIMTTRCKQAQETFMSFVTDVLDGVTVDNIRDRLDYLDEAFIELTSELAVS